MSPPVFSLSENNFDWHSSEEASVQIFSLDESHWDYPVLCLCQQFLEHLADWKLSRCFLITCICLSEHFISLSIFQSTFAHVTKEGLKLRTVERVKTFTFILTLPFGLSPIFETPSMSWMVVHCLQMPFSRKSKIIEEWN